MRYSFSLLIGLIFLISTDLLAGSYDSLRLESRGGQSIVIHEVEAGETIFGLSRRYGASVNEIKEASSLSENTLSIGQILSIPIMLTEPIEKVDTLDQFQIHEVTTGETLYGISRQYGLTVAELKTLNDMADNELKLGAQLIVGQKSENNEVADEHVVAVETSGEVELITDSLPGNVHVVGAGETIYSIARRYGVDVQELRQANELSSNNISIDQRLTIPFEIAGIEEIADSLAAQAIAVAEKPSDIDSTNAAIITTPEELPKYGNSDKRDTTNLVPGQVIEEGFAMKIENAPKTRKYLALHRTVPIGTIMQVRNQMNNQSIFVRVVGKLPDTGPNKKVLIRLTNQAFERLGAIDPKIPVEVAYMRE
ncbi:MAG: LysM peptidoglycan-binding domain-containing protein [Cyclobacteriaceae bacterium]